MAGYAVKPLNIETWPDFGLTPEALRAALHAIERHVRGPGGGSEGASGQGRSGARRWSSTATVASAASSVPDELRIKFAKAYGAVAAPPDWRSQAFVDTEYRHKVAILLKGPAEIARLGGGTVEGFRRMPRAEGLNSFLYNATAVCSSSGSPAPSARQEQLAVTAVQARRSSS
jgi:hypothetical protein